MQGLEERLRTCLGSGELQVVILPPVVDFLLQHHILFSLASKDGAPWASCSHSVVEGVKMRDGNKERVMGFENLVTADWWSRRGFVCLFVFPTSCLSSLPNAHRVALRCQSDGSEDKGMVLELKLCLRVSQAAAGKHRGRQLLFFFRENGGGPRMHTHMLHKVNRKKDWVNLFFHEQIIHSHSLGPSCP